MPKRIRPLLGIAIIVGAAMFLWRYEIHGLDKVSIHPRGTAAPASHEAPPATEPRSSDVIRIASFNIQAFGEAKLGKPHVMTVLAAVIRKFDVVAIQEIRAASQDVLPRFIEQINAPGRYYDYVIGPRLGRSSSKEQYAFIFDRTRIEVDRGAMYTVSDPNDFLHREPFVAPFRVRGPNPEQAFTFTLVNIHTDPGEKVAELNVLDDVIREVRRDGRAEDDVILLGDLNADDLHLGELGQMRGIVCAISGIPTNTRGSAQYDNVLFDQQATVEYIGRSGVLDLMREFNLTMQEAIDVSDHLPVWAEFSVYEGGLNGPLASRPSSPAATNKPR